MAYATGSYTDENNALDLLSAWGVTNGWTEDLNTLEGGTNRRVHLSKTIDTLACYFSLKVMLNQAPFTPYTSKYVTGIAVQGATGYSAGADWNNQTNRTSKTPTDSTSMGGNVDGLKSTGGFYYFFATATTLTAVFETESAQADWRIITIGNVGGYIFYSASGGEFFDTGSTNDDRSQYMGELAGCDGASSVRYDGDWYTRGFISGGGVNSIQALIDPTTSPTNPSGSVPSPLVLESPDLFRGNAVLAPSSVMIQKTLNTEYYPVGDIEGIKFVNMKNYANGQEVAYGSGTYKLFRIFNPALTGVAILK